MQKKEKLFLLGTRGEELFEDGEGDYYDAVQTDKRAKKPNLSSSVTTNPSPHRGNARVNGI